MGVVYLARDSRLARAVAIKSLPEHLACDPDRLARFEREARTLAQLSHANVGGIFGVEEHEGARYLILEYVEGRSLAQMLDRGPLPVDEAIELAIQIAAGVEAAHEAGVVHRDLKPANVMVTPEGRATVLDFGLARVDESGSTSGTMSESPTLTSPVQSPSVSGVILGTAAYMSPEQARGRRVDKRTDIWSFGVMMYEMLTGSSPFVGETISDSIGAVLHKDPDLSRLPKATPAHVRRVLARCLERDKDRRYRDIGDARFDLEGGDAGADGRATTARGSRAPFWGAIGVLAIALAGLAGVAFMRPAPASPRPVRLSIEAPDGARIVFSGDLAGPPVVSPDGSSVAFCAAQSGEPRRLWLRTLDDPRPRELPGTQGALFPFWKPDGSQIGFFTVDTLHRFDVASETVQKICTVNQSRGGSWTDDGRIIFSRNFRGSLFIIDENGGEPAPLTQLDEALHTSHRWPFHISGTDRFLFAGVSAQPGGEVNNAIYMGTLGTGEQPERVTRSDFGAAYARGHLLHVRDNVLLASPLRLGGDMSLGTPTVIARDIQPDLSTWHPQFSASAGGVLVYNRRTNADARASSPSGYAWAVEGDRVTLFDYAGRALTTYAPDTAIRGMSVSPDGATLAMDIVSEDGYPDIWLYPTAWIPEQGSEEANRLQAQRFVTEPRRFTFLEGPEVEPVWSPTSDEIAFRWDGDGTRPLGIYRKRVGGGTEILVRDNEGERDYPVDWTRDGAYLITVSGTLLASENNDIWAISFEDGSRIPLVVGPSADTEPQVSPDGRWLAYMHSEGGRNDIYVIPFAPAWPEAQRDRRWLISENGGRQARWSREGDRLFYITDASVLVALDVDPTGETFQFSAPRALFQSPWDVGRDFEPSPNNDKGVPSFFFVDSAEKWDAPIATVLNWPSLLRE